MKPKLLGWLLLLAAATATAADEPPDDAARRAQLKLERAAIQQNHTQRQAACRDTFAVTDCLKKARLDMQASMKHVHEQELALNDAARERRAAATAERLNAKAGAARTRQESASAPSATSASDAPASGASRPASKKRNFELEGLPKPSTPRSAQDEAQARERFETRQREIREHRDEVRRRNAEKAKKAPAAPPLPVPTAASAAAGG